MRKKFYLTPWKMGIGRFFAIKETNSRGNGYNYWAGVHEFRGITVIAASHMRISEELYLALHKEAKSNFATYAAAVSNKDRGWKP
jgi:hypothetical protein